MSSVRSERGASSRVSGLMRMPMNGGSDAGDHRGGDLLRGGGGVAVLFVVGAIAVAVFEVDAEVFDGFARELLADALVDLGGEVAANADRFGERRGIGRVAVERLQRELAELLRRLGREQMRAAVDGVHRLARAGVAGVALREPRLRAVDAIERFGELLLGERGTCGHGRVVSQLPR